MKRQTILISLMLLVASCQMEEDPRFFSTETLFTDEAGANTVLNGIYSAMIGNDLYAADYHHLFGMTSGLFNTNRDASLKDAAALNPFSSLNFVVDVWARSYSVINRSNDLIMNMENISFPNEAEHSNLLGQGYFIRALMYFNLVRAWGDVPLITEPVNSDQLNFPRENKDLVLDQVISDCRRAIELLPEAGENNPGRPANKAANFLLAKVFMWKAGNLRSTETDDWQNAYVEAIQVLDQYQLVQDFNSLWFAETGNNTSESIFEIHSNDEFSLDVHKLFTASNGHAGKSSWGRVKPNLEVYDAHVNRYPHDPRVYSTFVTEYTYFKTAATTSVKITYPITTARNDKHQSYPFIFKYFMKDIYQMGTTQTHSYVPFRYAELLLMLAEIENELNGPANAYQYVNQVLTRARFTPDSISSQPADWSGMTQEQFRDSIMYEYQFELLGEGQDWFRVRRRGYDYFKTHVIDVHNTHPLYDFSVERDVEYPETDRIMLLPISQNEINANTMISEEDQNQGY